MTKKHIIAYGRLQGTGLPEIGFYMIVLAEIVDGFFFEMDVEMPELFLLLLLHLHPFLFYLFPMSSFSERKKSVGT